jgi:hypothetical protein
MIIFFEDFSLKKSLLSLLICGALFNLILFPFHLCGVWCPGNLRRKYDGLKYSKKRLEDLLFEQSLLPDAASSANEQEEPPVKRPKNQEKDAGSAAADEAKAAAQAQGESKPSKDEGGEASTSPSLVDADEMALIRARFEASDAAREIIIKGCRDGQKLAKQVYTACSLFLSM